MLTVYARREPTTDAATLEARRLSPGAFAGAQDIAIYRDADAQQRFARFAHDRAVKPRPRSRTVTLNGYRWRLEWLPDLVPVAPSRSIHARTEALGLRAITYTNKATPAAADTEGRSYWIPRDVVARDGRAGVFYRIADADRRDIGGATYDFDGWEPWAEMPGRGVSFGGRSRTYESALAWLEQHRGEAAA